MEEEETDLHGLEYVESKSGDFDSSSVFWLSFPNDFVLWKEVS